MANEIQITKVETFEITVPNAVGFLLLKTTVGHYREEPKDAYDIYYYCRYSEDSVSIREMLAKALAETGHRPNRTRSENKIYRH